MDRYKAYLLPGVAALVVLTYYVWRWTSSRDAVEPADQGVEHHLVDELRSQRGSAVPVDGRQRQIDLDVLVTYFEANSPVAPGPQNRITRLRIRPLGDVAAASGKWKTTLQIIGISFMLYREPLIGLPVYRIGEWLVYVAAALTLWSMIDYLRAAWPAMRDQS